MNVYFSHKHTFRQSSDGNLIMDLDIHGVVEDLSLVNIG